MIISKSVHLAINGITSFFFHGCAIFIVHIYHIFVRSSLRGHFCGFRVLAIINTAAKNIEVHISFLLMFLSFLDICPGMGLLDPTVNSILVFQRPSILFSIANQVNF